MKRKYCHIETKEKMITELLLNGKTLREIALLLGFTLQQMKNFKTRYNKKQKKIAAGIPLRSKGRPAKETPENPDSLWQLKNSLAKKEAEIRALERENGMLRDFPLFVAGRWAPA